jgi:hypothetical protein
MVQQHEKISKNKTSVTSGSTGGSTAVQLKDNREYSVVQQKLSERTSAQHPFYTPIQRKVNDTRQSGSYSVFMPVKISSKAPVQLMPTGNNVIQFELKDTLILIGTYLGVKPSVQSIAVYFGITAAMLTSYITPLFGLGTFIIVSMLRVYGNYYRKGLHNTAVAQNLAYKLRVRQIANAGHAQNVDLRLKNSSEWILRNQTNVLSATGDSYYRVAAAKKNPRKYQTLFGGSLNSGAEEYQWGDLQDNSDVFIELKGELGSQNRGAVTLVLSPGILDNTIRETIKHEVQHDADEHRKEKGDDALIGYETEYRAYSYQGGDLDTLSNKKLTSKEEYTWTEKQYRIFTHIRANYPYVKNAWNNPNLIKRKKFRDEVVAYKKPDNKGVNKINSIRITNFWGQLLFVPANLKNTYNDEYKQLIRLSFDVGLNILTKDDAQYILTDGKKIQAKMKELMPQGGKAYQYLIKRLKSVK